MSAVWRFWAHRAHQHNKVKKNKKKKERDVITLMSIKEGQTQNVCCVEIFKVSERDNEVAVCNEYPKSVAQGVNNSYSFNATNWITHLKICHPGQCEKFVKIKQDTRDTEA